MIIECVSEGKIDFDLPRVTLGGAASPEEPHLPNLRVHLHTRCRICKVRVGGVLVSGGHSMPTTTEG